MVTSTTMMNMELNFEFDKPFEEKTTDGREVTTTVVREGPTRWVSTQINKKPGGKDVKLIRDFSDAGIDVQMICEDVVSKQFFARQ